MDYLDYVQMTKGQRFAYRFTSFFKGIPGAIKKFFIMIGTFVANIFKAIGRFFKAYGSRFAKGDVGTKLSYIIMGAGNMMHKQFVKGLIFLATEVAYIYFMFTFGAYYLSRIYCGSAPVDERLYQGVTPNPVILTSDGRQGIMRDDPEKLKLFYTFGTGTIGKEPAVFEETDVKTVLTNPDTYDDSNKVLLFFVLTVIVTIAFFAIYIANTKSAYATQQTIASGKKPDSFAKEIKSFLDERFHVTLLFLPIVLLLTFTVLPIIFTIFMAFTNYDASHQPPSTLYQWVGVKNFADVFYSNPMKSETFGKILLWTLVWAVFATFTNYIFGIILALMINKKGIRFKGFWRTMFVVTAAVPQFVTLLIMKLMLDEKGPVNSMLNGMGIESIPFLKETTWARVTVIVVNMWVGIPYTMLISSGLLMNIPEDLYESARIDGANAVQQFTKITFPYIFFVTTPYLITTFVGNINNFNVIFFLTGGEPKVPEYYRAGKTDLLVTWLYKLTVDTKDFNLAAVVGIMVFIICAAGSLITFNMSKASKNEEEFS